MSKLERIIVVAAVIITFLWGGGLVTAYLLKTPEPTAAVAPTIASPATPSTTAASPTGGQPPAAVTTPATPLTPAAVAMLTPAGAFPGAAPSAMEVPTLEDRRKRLTEFWASGQGGRMTQRQPIEQRVADVAGTILPPPADPAVAATMVSLHVKDVTPRAALAALGKATGAHYLVYPPNTFVYSAYPNVTIDADNQPVMEVLGRLCGNAGLRAVNSPRRSFGWNGTDIPQSTPQNPVMLLQPGEGPAPRFVSGAFSFELQRVSHSATLGADSGPSVASCDIAVNCEPKVTVLAIRLLAGPTEAVDEVGHSLTGATPAAPAAAVAPAVSASGGRSLLSALAHAIVGGSAPVANVIGSEGWQQPQDTIDLQLHCPSDVGRKIAVLKATPTFLIQIKSDSIDVPVAIGGSAVTKDIAGLTAMIGPLISIGSQQFSCRFQFTRGKQDDVTWERLRTVFSSLSPTLVDKDGKQLGMPNAYMQSTDDKSVAVNANWYLGARNSDGTPISAVPAKLLLTLPTEMREVAVPIELHDVPLP